MRTEAVRAVGGYPRGIDIATDYGLYIRLRRAGWRFAYVDRRSTVYRWPEPKRGFSFDQRRTHRHELKLFAALAVRAPRDAAIRARLRTEVKEVIGSHLPFTVRARQWFRAASSRDAARK